MGAERVRAMIANTGYRLVHSRGLTAEFGFCSCSSLADLPDVDDRGARTSSNPARSTPDPSRFRNRTGTGGQSIQVIGVSEIVRNKAARFLSEIEGKGITILD